MTDGSAMELDAQDLAILSDGFAAAMTSLPDSASIVSALFDLGWGELLAAAPGRGAAAAFSALGQTGSSVGLIDDVLAGALGLTPSPAMCVVLPRPQRCDAPGLRGEGCVRVDGLVSARIDSVESVVVAAGRAEGDSLALLTIPAGLLPYTAGGLDDGAAYRRVTVDVPLDAVLASETSDRWGDAVVAARIALAHQLVAAASWMLAAAREHALERVQFGKPVSSFQAVRHKLAESLVSIEAAASVATACTEDDNQAPDPLLGALAKSLAGAAARTTGTHAQQVLAGIGFTTDHQFHRWLKRSIVVDTLFGSSTTIPTEIGRELRTRGNAPRLLDL